MNSNLQHQFRRLFRSMDFLSAYPALKRGGKESERVAEVYQQLGLL